MGIRTLATAALCAAAFTLGACSGSDGTTDGGVDAGNGCVGFCGGGDDDGGTDAGNGTDAGTDAGVTDGGQNTDGGVTCYNGELITVTLRDLREKSDVCTLPFGAHVLVKDVVVHTVSYSNQGTEGDYRADFWVSDPNDPPYGIWVSKYYTDEPGPYLPAPGDVLTIDGYFGTVSKYENPTGYRRQIASKKVGSSFLPITLTKTGTAPVPEAQIVTPGQFGDTDGGTLRPNPEYAGSRVYIQGPIEITNPKPAALRRVSANPDDDLTYGFEVTGGILINNSKTYKADGGCPWQDIALDAGMHGEKVVFTQGIYGVYDSWTFAPCSDGGTDIFNCYPNDEGRVPGTTNDYTYVVYPQTCDDFAGGEVQPQ
ncbi:MAG: hypothetical protein IRZ16_13040 [Myxococcaceae bacterium]|nr:hypothetical protein [Myxococcaceae bacterium]